MYATHRSSIAPDATDGSGIESAAAKNIKIEGSLRLLRVIEAPGEVLCCRFSSDGNVIAAGILDGSIMIYEADSGKVLHVLADEDTKKHRLPTSSIRFVPYSLVDAPQQRHLLLASYVSGHVKIWHYTSGKCVASVLEPRQLLCASINADGTRFLTTGATAHIQIYDLATKRRVASCEPSESRELMNGHRSRVFSAMYYPNSALGTLFVSGGWDNTLHFWDERVRHSQRRLYGPHICGADAIDIDPTNGTLLTASWTRESPLQMWDFATGEKIKDISQDGIFRSQLYACQYASKDLMFCGGSDYNVARLIDRASYGTSGGVSDLPAAVYAVDSARANSGLKLCLCSSNCIFVLSTARESRRITAAQGNPGGPTPNASAPPTERT